MNLALGLELVEDLFLIPEWMDVDCREIELEIRSGRAFVGRVEGTA